MINIQNLTFSYPKQPVLFDDLTLQIKAGSIVGLLGKNGAGKSTLLKLMSGLLSPQKGESNIFEKRPRLRKPSFLEQVFFVPEVFSVPSITINAYVKASASMYPLFDYSKMETILNDFELDKTKKLSDMSYGQQKKFLIAFALSTNCRLLLLDEPTNGLDIPSKTQFRRIIASTGTENRLIIISTHQVRDMENLIDPIIIVDEGKVIFNESIERVTDRLTVKKISEEPIEDTVLYSEKEIDGYKVVLANKNHDQTDIDFETLFNTVVSNPRGIKSVFNGGTKNERN